MPPKKAKDETSNTKTDRDSNNPNLNLQSTPDIQVQNTKFDGIVLLSPAAQQLQKILIVQSRIIFLQRLSKNMAPLITFKCEN